MTRTAQLVALLLIAGCNSDERLVPRTVDEDATIPAEEWNDSRFHVVRSGLPTGVPIIYLAGGPGNDNAYLSRLTTTCDGHSFGDSHLIVMWDQRGCGLSKRHATSLLTLETFRVDLDGLVDRVDPAGSGVILVGHSWGGMFATDYVDRHPTRVKGLVLLEPGQLTDVLAKSDPSTISVPITAEWVSDLAWSQDFLSLSDHARLDFSLLIAVKGEQLKRDDREQYPIVRFGGAVVRHDFLNEFVPSGYDFTQNLAAFTTEVLIIAGDQATDNLNETFQEKQAVFFPHATLELLAGDSHMDLAWADGCKSAGLMADYFDRIGQN